MKFLFVLLIPFLVSINFVSEKNNVVDSNEVTLACNFYIPVRDDYLKQNYKYLKSYSVDFKQTEKCKIEYTLVADKGHKYKLITEFRNQDADNIDVILKDSRRRPLKYETRKISEKQLELKTIIPEKGIYYLSFLLKDTINRIPVCGVAFLLEKGKQDVDKQQKLQLEIQEKYKK